MMCETMANIPVEEKSSYVLTEDMIDAAMNEQFAFQEDLESEGETSSLEEIVEVDQDSQESGGDENIGVVGDKVSTVNSTFNVETNVNVNLKRAVTISPSSSPISNNNQVSVLVIETGLDKSGNEFVKSVKETSSSKEKQNENTVNSSCNLEINQTGSDLAKTKAVDHNTRENKEDLSILESVLSDDKGKDGIIDLCDSEVDDFLEEDDIIGAESIDDELKSVMETNLMAEIGLAVNKRSDTEPCPEKQNVEKAPESVGPRISVKNIAQISTHAFNSLSPSRCVNSLPYSEDVLMNRKINENQVVRNQSFALRNPNLNSNIPLNENNQGPIHLNKIAVPHSTFVNSHGQRMKCVYVKSTSTLPFVINSPTQTTATNTNAKYVFTQPMKKGPNQMPAITALKTLTKNIQPQTMFLQNNAKVLTLAQKVQKPPMLQHTRLRRYKANKTKKYNDDFDAVKKALIFNTKKQYIPPDTFPENPTYKCIDCNDKFLFKLSLANHIERRSMSIRYWCNLCQMELQFYNTCALSIHLRGHNLSLKQIDIAQIAINPISKEMVDKGIATAFLKDSEPNPGQLVKSTFYAVKDKSIQSNPLNFNSVDARYKQIAINPISKEMVDKGIATAFLKDSEPNPGQFVKSTFYAVKDKSIQSNPLNFNSADARYKVLSGTSSNVSNHKITTIAGQSKSVCYQTPSPSAVSRPVTSAVANPQPPNNVLPLLLPKAPNPVKTVTLISAQSLPNKVKEQSTSSNKSPPKNLILFCNKLPQSTNIHKNSVVNPSPPNVVCEPDSRPNTSPTVIENNDTEMVVDDDVTVVQNVTEEEEIVDVENVDGSVTSSSSPVVLNSEAEKSIFSKRSKSPTSSLPPNQNKRNCTECKAYCQNISKHLNGSGRPLRSDLACKICNLILPSRCALKIHHRIHMKISPYRCPDCGKDFTSWDDLHAHLKFSCGHFAKCVRYICKGCKAHFPTQHGLAQHIVKNHGKDIYKCSLCPVAFYKKPSLIKHIFNEHPNEKNKSKIGLDYKQCEMCPKKLLAEDSYIAHAKEHTNSMIYGYKCSMCNIVYANKMAFIIHQIKEKTKKDNLDKSGDLSKTIPNEKPEDTLQVSDSNSDYEDEPEIIRKYPEIDDELAVAEKDPLSLDDWECTQEQKVKEKTRVLCIVCKKKSVVLLPGIDLNRQSLCCKQCVKPLDGDSSTELIKGSYNTVNSFSKSDKKRRRNPKNIYRSSSTDEAKSVTKKRRMSDISCNSSPENNHLLDPLAESPSRKKTRRKQKGKSNPIDQTHIQGQVIKSRSLDELCHKCSKCDFATEERESFLEHITVHRTDPNTYQCLECGLCFVVLPSLERHLQMHHSIKDVRSYTEKNQASLPQKAVQVEEETPDNQCRVCYETFDCKSSLDKHFRTHGMAFMSRLSNLP